MRGRVRSQFTISATQSHVFVIMFETFAMGEETDLWKNRELEIEILSENFKYQVFNYHVCKHQILKSYVEGVNFSNAL